MPMMMKIAFLKTRLLLPVLVAVASLAATAHAAAPGITGPTFNLTAQPAFLNQPDGSTVYSWGYGCNGAPSGFAPAAIAGATCPTMQVPRPTMIVTEGQTVTVNLTNDLPTPAGNTSILFPGFKVATTGGVTGLMAQEAAPGGTVTYIFVAGKPGTHSYYSGTQGNLQVEMGLYGAIIVLPASVPASCASGLHQSNLMAEAHWGEADFRLAAAAYDHPATCYDREYLFQFSEMDANIHAQALAQVTAIQNSGVCTTATAPGCSLEVPTEPYHPAYFMINGRSMPDDMDPNYDTPYPHQPTTATLTCIRVNRFCCASPARAAGSIPSTNTPITSAFWLAMETSSSLPTAWDWQGLRSSPPPPPPLPARPWMASSTSREEA